MRIQEKDQICFFPPQPAFRNRIAMMMAETRCKKSQEEIEYEILRKKMR